MKAIFNVAIFLLFISTISTKADAAPPILEQVAAMINKQLPKVTSNGESEMYKVEVANDTLVHYYRFYVVKKSEIDVNNNEALDILYNNLKMGYCSQPYDFYQKDDYKWKKVYVDSEYNFLFSFTVSRRDC